VYANCWQLCGCNRFKPMALNVTLLMHLRSFVSFKTSMSLAAHQRGQQ